MKQGRSNQRGILFVDPSMPGDNAVYCVRENGRPVCIAGPMSEIESLFKEDMKRDARPEADREKNRILAGVILFMIAFVVAVVFLDGRPQAIAGTVVFAVVGAFPLLVIGFTRVHTHAPDDFTRFRRHHGAEHAAFAYYRAASKRWDSLDEDKPLPEELEAAIEGCTADALASYDHRDPECGTVHSAGVFIWAIIAGMTIAHFDTFGILETVGIIAGSAVILFINTAFNPVNPLKAAQNAVVAKPDEEARELAAAGMRAFMGLMKGDGEEPRVVKQS